MVQRVEVTLQLIHFTAVPINNCEYFEFPQLLLKPRADKPKLVLRRWHHLRLWFTSDRLGPWRRLTAVTAVALLHEFAETRRGHVHCLEVLLHVIFAVSLAGEVVQVGVKASHYSLEVLVTLKVFEDCVLQVRLVEAWIIIFGGHYLLFLF